MSEISPFDQINEHYLDLIRMFELSYNTSYKNCMSITLTLNPKLYKYCSITQYELSVLEVKSLLHQLSESLCSVELTAVGNIHYHIIAHEKDKFRWISFFNKLRKKSRVFGFNSHKSINCAEHLHVSLMYLIKDLDETAKTLHNKNYKPSLFFRI